MRVGVQMFVRVRVRVPLCVQVGICVRACVWLCMGVCWGGEGGQAGRGAWLAGTMSSTVPFAVALFLTSGLPYLLPVHLVAAHHGPFVTGLATKLSSNTMRCLMTACAMLVHMGAMPHSGMQFHTMRRLSNWLDAVQVLNSPHEAKAHLTNRPASDHKSEVQVIRTGTPIKKLLTQPLTSKERRKLQRRRNELRKQIASLAGKDKLSRKESKRYNNAHRELGELDKEYGHVRVSSLAECLGIHCKLCA